MDKRAIKDAALRHQDLILQPFGKIMNMDGFDAIAEFARVFGGSNVYIPSIRTIFKECIEHDILYLYTGKNLRELVKMYGFSERHIRNILSKP